MADLIWVYAEVVDGKISRATLELLSKAAELGTAEAVLLGPAPDDAITTLSQHGASKVYRSDDAIYRDHPTLPAVETIAALIASHRPAVMLFASSYGGRDVAATLSAKLDCGALTDVGDLTLTGSAIEATIPALGGSYQNSATLTGSGTKLVLVRPKAFEMRPRAVPATVEEVAAPR
ncbi:MAG: electron transfer flavoprotein subunit alpha/FixB family protein, partial [Candidatus Rokuibacteriota bacterium]